MNKELYGKKFRLPESILKSLDDGFKSVNADSNTEGFNRNKELRDNGYVTYQTLKRWKNWFDQNSNDSDSTEYILNGGDKSKNWVNNTLDYLRKEVELSKKNKKYGEGNLDVDVQIAEEIKKINRLIKS